MNNENPLTKLGDITKPATVLIEKISDALGGVFKPYQIIRVAKAEAEANLIHTESQIQITDLNRRALNRFIEEEAKRQTNIESITLNALPLLQDKSNPQNIEDDWITNFFDKSRIISDKNMQNLWSRVLAGEANTPGTFAKRTVNLLADLDKDDAILFTRLCGFSWVIDTHYPLIFDEVASIYNDQGINFGSLSHLESLGFLQFNTSGLKYLELGKVITIYYHGQPVTLTFPKGSGNELKIGKVLLTRAGQQLAPVCSPTPVEGYLEYVKKMWIAQSLIM